MHSSWETEKTPVCREGDGVMEKHEDEEKDNEEEDRPN